MENIRTYIKPEELLELQRTGSISFIYVSPTEKPYELTLRLANRDELQNGQADSFTAITWQEARDYCRQLIRQSKENGGFLNAGLLAADVFYPIQYTDFDEETGCLEVGGDLLSEGEYYEGGGMLFDLRRTEEGYVTHVNELWSPDRRYHGPDPFRRLNP